MLVATLLVSTRSSRTVVASVNASPFLLVPLGRATGPHVIIGSVAAESILSAADSFAGLTASHALSRPPSYKYPSVRWLREHCSAVRRSRFQRHRQQRDRLRRSGSDASAQQVEYEHDELGEEDEQQVGQDHGWTPSDGPAPGMMSPRVPRLWHVFQAALLQVPAFQCDSRLYT